MGTWCSDTMIFFWEFQTAGRCHHPKQSGHLVQWHRDWFSGSFKKPGIVTSRNIWNQHVFSVWARYGFILNNVSSFFYLEQILYYNRFLQLIILNIWCKCFHSTFCDYLKGLKVLKKDKWWCKVTFCFVYQVCEILQFRRPLLMSNDILLQILELWDFVEMFEIAIFRKRGLNLLVDIIIYYYYSTPIN